MLNIQIFLTANEKIIIIILKKMDSNRYPSYKSYFLLLESPSSYASSGETSKGFLPNIG